MTDDLHRVIDVETAAELRRAEALALRPWRRAGRVLVRLARRVRVWAQAEWAASSGHGPDIPEDMW